MTITLGFPKATLVYSIALLGTNLTSAATITWQVSNDATTWYEADSAFTIAGTTAWRDGRFYTHSASKYHRLTISTTVGSYIEVGEIYLAGGYWPTGTDTVQPLKSSQRWIETETSRVETFAGSAIADVRGAREMYSLRYAGLQGSQLAAFRAASVGRYVVLSPQGHQGRAIFGLWSMGKETLESRVRAEVLFEEVT